MYKKCYQGKKLDHNLYEMHLWEDDGEHQVVEYKNKSYVNCNPAESTLKGLNKLILNKEKLNSDLEDNWAVIAEAIQTILRRENYPNPYEALKNLTRTNQKINKDSISSFIETLEVSESIKNELRALTPQNYTGI